MTVGATTAGIRASGTWQPLGNPVFRTLQRFLEVFEVPSWDTHLRQHGGRLTGPDAAIEARADALATGPSSVHHYFPADDVPIEGNGQDDATQEGSSAASVGQSKL
jgi:hypothetical protein